MTATAAEAVARAIELRDHPSNKVHGYELGTGDYHEDINGEAVMPWTPSPYVANTLGTDCAGAAICHCFRIVRHEPGLNHQPSATVSDDWNVNSAIETAGRLDLGGRFVVVPRGDAILAGDLLCYPTFRMPEVSAPFIGHVGIVVDASKYDGTFASLRVCQSCGPDGRMPAVIETDGAHWDDHDRTWPLPQHRTVVLRVA